MSDLPKPDIVIDDQLLDDDNYKTAPNLNIDCSFDSEVYHLVHPSSPGATSSPLTSPTSTKNTSGSRVKELVKIHSARSVENLAVEPLSSILKVKETNISTRSQGKPLLAGLSYHKKNKPNMASIGFSRGITSIQNRVESLVKDIKPLLESHQLEGLREKCSQADAIKINLSSKLRSIEVKLLESDIEESAQQWSEIEKKAQMAMEKLVVHQDKCKNLIQHESNTGKTLAGKLARIEVPNFTGDVRKFRMWRVKFETLMQGHDSVTTRMYLVEALREEAYKWVEDLIIGNQPLDAIWKELEAHFGNQKKIVDTTIKAFF